ncbi:ABC transporter permease subunit [Paracoccus shanxieyensis]|uniref:ABC transporter permease subunit n=1 Tax=Paracoccus shanxieyensis TaxID=2675752 RepID=A0A6L6IXY0_9RHOB|nr:ABC transporter permease subunit [Paracoccus shanxieyensis]MTH64132.1 ABC transporter permease subunit [Paracoccus shanxieyensis]MTH87276.1 ABC transporter permease subunit [Paracoccus shanxieyensis]
MTLWKNRKVRAIGLQAAFVAAIACCLVVAVLTARERLAAQGIKTGFGFLQKATGWEMTFSLLPTTAFDPYWWVLLMGLLNTLFIGVLSLIFATLIGGVIGIARISPNKAFRLVGTVYVEAFRNIPLIVQVFFWYALANRLPPPRQAYEFAGGFLTNRGLYLPGVTIAGWSIFVLLVLLAVAVSAILALHGLRRFRRVEPARKRALSLGIALAAAVAALVVGWAGYTGGAQIMTWPAVRGLNIQGGYRIPPEIYALVFAIAIYGGAYVAEIVRGGFNAVSKGQVEAAQSLGLTPWSVFSRVRFPLAFRSMLPILTNQYVWLIKATTLGIIVGFADFFMVVNAAITHSGQTFELVGLLMVTFLIINFTLAAILNRINKAVALKGHQLRG